MADAEPVTRRSAVAAVAASIAFVTIIGAVNRLGPVEADAPTHYRGVALGGRRDSPDLRTWIDTFGTMGHGTGSYDAWTTAGRPRDASGAPVNDPLEITLVRLEGMRRKDMIDTRQRVIRLLWGDAGLPHQAEPLSVTTDVLDPRFASLDNLVRIDRLVVHMDYALNSIIYVFRPQTPNQRLLIYHQGHLGGFVLGIETIRFFLQQGYTVAALAMPLKGMNSRPSIEIHGERLTLSSHEDFRRLEAERFFPVRLFLEPVVVLLNYVLAEQAYDLVAMVGLSGGGWTATLVAALDPRVDRSYPVAGSMPLALHDSGDYEQRHPQLYAAATYPDLYVLGALDDGRRQVQILNRYDPCCFGGTSYEAYAARIAGILRRLGGGTFDVWSDTTHREHKISAAARAVIQDDLARP